MDNDLVFAKEVGKPIQASNLRRRSFEPLLKEAWRAEDPLQTSAIAHNPAPQPGFPPKGRF